MEYTSVWIGLWLILTIIIGFISIVFNVDCDNKKEWIFGKFLLITFIIMLAIFIFGMHKMCNAPITWEITATESIVSLNDNNMTNGKFYVRRGYINEDLWYQYMVDVGGGGYVANKVPSNGTTVYHTEVFPRCEWYRVSQKWWIFEQWKTNWKLYVPEGTIGNDFNIDLQ